MGFWGGAGEKGRGGPDCGARREGWLTLFLLPEPREFQASPLLLPAPSQVCQPAGRVASLLECHALQLCQHMGRDHPRDKDWAHRASRHPTQVPHNAWLSAVEDAVPCCSHLCFPLVLCPSLFPTLSLSSVISPLCAPTRLPTCKNVGVRKAVDPHSESQFLVLTHGWG